MFIEKATIIDLAALRALEKVCFPLDAWPLLDLIAVLSMPGVLRLKAVEDGMMAGFAAVDPRSSEGVSWIATIGVLPKYQGRGFGRALLQACEEKVSTPLIRLCVRPDNSAAIGLYRAFGYEVIDTWRGYYNDGTDGLIMQKTHTPYNQL